MANVIREAGHSRHIVTFSPLFFFFLALQQNNVVSLLVASLSVSLLSSLPAPVWRTEADWALRGVSMGKPFYVFNREGKSAFQTDARNKCNLAWIKAMFIGSLVDKNNRKINSTSPSPSHKSSCPFLDSGLSLKCHWPVTFRQKVIRGNVTNVTLFLALPGNSSVCVFYL